MTDAFIIVALGFVLGMRHATDADHVVAVTTIVSRHTGLRPAVLTGLLWGLGHSLTVTAVGAVIILFNVTIPERVGMGMEVSVGAMLVVLGVMNMATFRPSRWRALAERPKQVHSHAHNHGDYVHTHPHGHTPEVHPHDPGRTPVTVLDRRFGRLALYGWLRPIVVGVVHGLAGSAAVTLLVVAAVREPAWAVAYLLVFGVGTIAGMILVTFSLASAARMVAGSSAKVSGRLGFATGVASVVFGIVFAYQSLILHR